MNKTSCIDVNNKIAVDITTLQGMLSIGKNSADELGTKAGAVIRIGRRKLYNVKKIEAYIENLKEA